MADHSEHLKRGETSTRRTSTGRELIPSRPQIPGERLADFRGHEDYPTVGVELEVLLCRANDRDVASTVFDPATGTQRSAFDAVKERTPTQAGNPEHQVRVDQEFMTNTCEITTGIHRTAASATRELAESATELRKAARELNLRLLSVGAHPFARAADQQITADPRSRNIVRTVGKPARDMQTTGLHVHVAVPTGDVAIKTVDVLTRLAPLFIALSASSPYWESEDTSFASYRTLVFRGMPATGLPPHCRTWNEYRQWYDALRRVGRIEKHKDVHTDVRPSPGYGTVELRVCDAPSTLGEVGALVALCQCLVAQIAFPDIAEPGVIVPPGLLALRHNLLEDNIRSAARYGITGHITVDNRGTTVPIAQAVRQLVRSLAPVARRLNCVRELESVLDILTMGPSATRQQQWVAGGDSLTDVVDSLIEEFETGVRRIGPLPGVVIPRTRSKSAHYSAVGSLVSQPRRSAPVTDKGLHA